MPIAEIFTLTTLGASVIGWGIGKVCDTALLTSHAEMQRRLKDNSLDPNHDIEAAVLTAHYKALEFIVEDTFAQKEDKRVQDYSDRLKYLRGKQGFRRIFKTIETRDFKGLLPAIAGDWQTVIPANFEAAGGLVEVHQATLSPYAAQAKADLLSLATWSDVEKKALSERAIHPDLGWAPSFSACLREQIKINDPFRHIYMAQIQEHQLAYLQDISAKLNMQLAPGAALIEAMSRVEASLGRIETKVDDLGEGVAALPDEFRQIIEETIKKNKLSESGSEQLYGQITDLKIERALTEERILKFLKIALPHVTVEKGQVRENLTELLDLVVKDQAEYVRQAQIPSNDPNELSDLREEIAAFLSDFEIDKARDALRAARATHKDKMEDSARLEASYLIEEAKIEVVDLNIDKAMSLYKDAANTIKRYDIWQALYWLRKGGDTGYERGRLFGGGFLKQSIAYYQSALSHICDEAGLALSGFEDVWAMLHNDLGIAYRVLGGRGEDGALDKAVTAYEAALTVYTREAAPINWAMTQNNLGIIYSILGKRGEDGALDKAVTAYEAALTVYTRDAAPMDWAAAQNNLGNVYRILDVRGEDGTLDKAVTAYEAALTVRTRDAVPMKWAMTQNNLGNAYFVLGKRGEDSALNKAVTAYEAALTVSTRDTAPMDWAAAQNNLGSVHRVLGSLDKAVTAYEAALTVYIRDAAPMDWAMTLENLGYALWGQGKKKEAETCFRDAHTEFKKQGAVWYSDKIEKNMRSRGLTP